MLEAPPVSDVAGNEPPLAPDDTFTAPPVLEGSGSS
jgi:hypothetical protein